MAIKAVVVDDENTQHLIIGLTRENVNSLLDGDVFTLPQGVAISISEKSDIVLLFAETDEALEKRFLPTPARVGVRYVRPCRRTRVRPGNPPRQAAAHERQGTASLRKVCAVYVLARGQSRKEPRQVFVIQLREAEKEWRHRQRASLR